MDCLSNSSKNCMKEIGRGQNVETLILPWDQNCLWPNTMYCIFVLRIHHILSLMTQWMLIFLGVPAKSVEVLLPGAGSSFSFQQCPIRVTGLDFEAWLDIGTWAPWVGSPAACVKPVCNTAAAELDILEWGPKITRSLPGGISTLRLWWLASKKYWRQRWRGNSGSTAWSGQDHSFVVFSTHLGRGNLQSQSQVQGLLDYFI